MLLELCERVMMTKEFCNREHPIYAGDLNFRESSDLQFPSEKLSVAIKTAFLLRMIGIIFHEYSFLSNVTITEIFR